MQADLTAGTITPEPPAERTEERMVTALARQVAVFEKSAGVGDEHVGAGGDQPLPAVDPQEEIPGVVVLDSVIDRHVVRFTAMPRRRMTGPEEVIREVIHDIRFV